MPSSSRRVGVGGEREFVVAAADGEWALRRSSRIARRAKAWVAKRGRPGTVGGRLQPSDASTGWPH